MFTVVANFQSPLRGRHTALGHQGSGRALSIPATREAPPARCRRRGRALSIPATRAVPDQRPPHRRVHLSILVTFTAFLSGEARQGDQFPNPRYAAVRKRSIARSPQQLSFNPRYAGGTHGVVSIAKRTYFQSPLRGKHLGRVDDSVELPFSIPATREARRAPSLLEKGRISIPATREAPPPANHPARSGISIPATREAHLARSDIPCERISIPATRAAHFLTWASRPPRTPVARTRRLDSVRTSSVPPPRGPPRRR